uniref:EF-hand domain-containing protein n=2 Tax=Strongyloides stercoralis TaxID=6248 RepID=A0AAF5I0B4_STRER
MMTFTFGQNYYYNKIELLCTCENISCLPDDFKMEIMRNIFDILDVNKNNITDFDEIYSNQLKPLNIRNPNAIVNGKKYSDIFYSLVNWIEKMDLDGDGKVTWVEFVSKVNEIFI